MNPTLDETQQLLRDTVRQYLEAEVPFSRIRDLEQSGKPDEGLWSALIDQGWIGSAFPESVGGGGSTLVEAGLIVEELARRAAVVPGVEVTASVAALLRHGGDAGEGLARDTLAGSCRPVPAVAEAGDDGSRIEAEVASGRLSGEKRFVDYASFATHHLVAAREGGALGLYCVASDAPGVTLTPTPCMARTPQDRVGYEGADAQKIGGEEAVAFLVNVARALTSVQIVGCMQQSLDMTVAYTNVREQFGRPIATFQAVQHHGANMAMHTESNRFLGYEALEALERGDATDEQVAILKASASRSVPEVTMLGHQLHGGQGFIEENDLYFFTIRGKDRALAWGSAEECLALIGESSETKPRWL